MFLRRPRRRDSDFFDFPVEDAVRVLKLVPCEAGETRELKIHAANVVQAPESRLRGCSPSTYATSGPATET